MTTTTTPKRKPGVIPPKAGNEFRGFRFRIYPTPEQIAELEVMTAQGDRVYNALVSIGTTARRAAEAKAAKAAGLIRPPKDADDTLKKQYWEDIKQAMLTYEIKPEYRSIKELMAQAKPHRTLTHGEVIAARQRADLPVGRLHARAARNAKQVLHRDIYPVTDAYQTIYVERLPSWIGATSSHVSSMRMLYRGLVSRYGASRVVEVDAAYTSRTCSECGHVHSESPSSRADRTLLCEGCGVSINTDVNAARNILARGAAGGYRSKNAA